MPSAPLLPPTGFAPFEIMLEQPLGQQLARLERVNPVVTISTGARVGAPDPAWADALYRTASLNRRTATPTAETRSIGVVPCYAGQMESRER